MAVTRTLLAFSSGLAAGAVAYATYPKWKHKVAPLVTTVVESASAAFRDAQTAAEAAAAAGAHDSEHTAQPAWVATERNGTGLAASSHP